MTGNRSTGSRTRRLATGCGSTKRKPGHWPSPRGRGHFDDASVTPARVTHLVTVSCSGFYAPSFDIALIKQLGLSADVARTHVGFMGCHGLLNGLRVASAFLDADRSACVLALRGRAVQSPSSVRLGLRSDRGQRTVRRRSGGPDRCHGSRHQPRQRVIGWSRPDRR